jgi:hypothetical protein
MIRYNMVLGSHRSRTENMKTIVQSSDLVVVEAAINYSVEGK